MAAPVPIEAETLGDAWLAVARRILDEGVRASYDGLATKELPLVTVRAASTDPGDAIVERLGDPAWSAWMRANFTEHGRVAELGGARSYADRLFDYAGSGRDQVGWVVERLRADPECRSAAITTFEPLSDTTYVPCVSVLDFWRAGGGIELVVYAHSLDFGKKAYGNLVELARLQHRVAGELGVQPAALVVHAKSAHVYETEWAAMERAVRAEPLPAG